MRSVATLVVLATLASAAWLGPALPAVAGAGGADGAGAAGAPGAAEAPLAPRVVQLGLGAADLRVGPDGLLGSRWETEPFDLLGLVWDSAADLPEVTAALPEVSVRTRAAGTWRQWRHLHLDEHGPDPADAPAAPTSATAPLWVGRADAVQLRMDAPGPLALPTGLRLVLIDSGEPADGEPVAVEPADGERADGVPADGVPADAVETAGASASASGPPPIASRAQWRADERLRDEPRYTGPVRAAFVHHTVDENDYAKRDVPGMIRGIYAFHTKARGWSDIGYNFLLDRWGRVWEGRAGGVELAVRGAHTGGFNVDSFGIAVLGNFQKSRPSKAVRASIARLITWKFDLADAALDPDSRTRLTSTGGGTSRYDAGHEVGFARISGHRDAGRTLCPGTHLYEALPDIRRRVAALQRRADLGSGSAEFGQSHGRSHGLLGVGEPPLGLNPESFGEVRKRDDPWARPTPPPFSPAGAGG